MIFRIDKNIRFLIIAIIMGTGISSCYREAYLVPENAKRYNYFLSFNDIQVGIDTAARMMLFPMELTDVNEFTVKIKSDPIEVISIEGIPLDQEMTHFFKAIDFKKAYNLEIRLPEGEVQTYQLYFTPMRVFQIYSLADIKDEPKIISWTNISGTPDQGGMIHSYMGIEYRGRSAFTRAKKSFGIEFWDDMYESGHKDVSFFNLPEDDDWILDAMYIDKSRLRNQISWDIWDAMIREGNKSYIDNAWTCKGGYVEVFLNTEYLGLYYLEERPDPKRLNITSSQYIDNGYFYKSEDWTESTEFKGLEEISDGYVWDGWELKYPKNPDKSSWQPLYKLLDFCINSSDSDFTSKAYEYIVQDNIIDYLLFINIIKGTDNYGNNQLLVKPTAQSRFLILPWDLDATWGRNFQAEELNQGDFYTNLLHQRLLHLNPEDFTQKLKNRWNILKKSIASPDQINSLIDGYMDYLDQSGAFLRDSLRWPECELNLEEERAYLKNWYQKRWDYLNHFYENLEGQQEPD